MCQKNLNYTCRETLFIVFTSYEKTVLLFIVHVLVNKKEFQILYQRDGKNKGKVDFRTR